MKQNSDLIHTPATVAIFQTTDYERFRMITGNRTLNMHKIKKIMADIESGTNLLKYNPILVVAREGLLDIIDGQHRFVVAKKVKDAVHYILAEDLTLYQIAKMNSNTEKWAPKDFIQCYVALQNEHYMVLDDLLKQFPKVNVSIATSLLQTGSVTSSGGTLTKKFQQGDFTVSYADKAIALLTKAAAFVFDAKFTASFTNALQKIIDAGLYDVDLLIEKVNADPKALQAQTSHKKYLVNLEEIANKGKQKRISIY